VKLKTAKALGINVPHNRLMSALLLHGEWDLNHHRPRRAVAVSTAAGRA
jgi:hypothetical protein